MNFKIGAGLTPLLDWEIDTVMGSRDHHCILTLVERKMGFTLIGKLRNKTKKEANACLLRLIKS